MNANDHDRADDARAATVRNLMSSAEGLLSALGEEGTQRYRDAVVDLQREIARARDDLDDVQYAAARRARLAARRVDHYVHENPWQSAGVAAGIGAAVGAMGAILIAHRQP